MSLKIPAQVEANCRKTPERAAWLARLPEILGGVVRRWSVAVSEPFANDEVSCAWVAAATLPDGTSAILKLAMPHMEGMHEIQGLRFWAGTPTVNLLEADEDLGAMLIERCRPGTPLRSVPEPEQDKVIAGLARRLWRALPNPHPFRPLSMLMKYWSDETMAAVERWPDTGLVREGLELFERLPRGAAQEVLLATDLHAGNVLKSERAPWLVIDPKPFAGDPAYDVTQHIFNCLERMSSDPHGLIRRLADLAEVDHDRVRLWTFARAAAEPRDDWTNPRRLSIARATAP